MDWEDIEKHLADPDLEVFGRTQDEDESEPLKHETVEKRRGLKRLRPHLKRLRLPPTMSYNVMCLYVIAYHCKQVDNL